LFIIPSFPFLFISRFGRLRGITEGFGAISQDNGPLLWVFSFFAAFADDFVKNEWSS
jgi:hypothetical protein